MEEKYTIILSDGTCISNLDLNGNNFISDTEIKESIFIRNCSPVTIKGGMSEDAEEFHDHMELVQITVHDGKYWFVLRDVPESELAAKKQRADIDYIAMMTDIEL